MPEEELDLVEFSPCLMAKSRACSTKIVRCDTCQSALSACLLDHAPDDLRAEACCCNPPGFVNSTEYGPFSDQGFG
jgi:hypothetical protein